MKIIKEGKFNHTYTCENCECVFEYDAEDVTRRTVWDDHGAHYPVCDFYDVICPFCNKKITLGSDFTTKMFTDNEKKKMKHIDD